MADASKLFCIVVRDSGSLGGKQGQSCSDLQDTYHSFRYTSSTLRSTLQLMGCKTRHAFKISKRVFEMIKGKVLVDVDKKANSLMDAYQLFSHVQEDCVRGYYIEEGQVREELYNKRSSSREDSNKVFFGKKRVVAVLKRELFFNIVCDALAEYRYVGPNQRTDLAIACRLRERKESIIILLSGASGCGKSTLSSLLASRLGITTVVSTDSIRHMMRGFVDENKNPLLWASTYHAGECLDPVSVAKAKARKKEKKNTGHVSNEQFSATMKNKQSNMKEKPGKSLPSETRKEFRDGKFVNDGNDVHSVQDIIGPKTMAIEGYKAQSEMVIDSLDRLITIWEERKESVVIEGVHLSLNFVMGLMKKHPSIIPFMIYIANEEKHLERFAVRAKYMTLDPQKNKYVKYIQNIRTIQEYLCDRAEKHLVPKVNNTNVDKSVASIHATVFSCLRRRDTGEQLYDQATNTVKTINDEFRNCCSANSVSSKGMFRLIQRKGSSRHLMALVNIDGSVEKAWPIDLVDSDGQHSTDPVYGPLQIGKEEPVHLQFGNFGISCWPHEAVGTSHANFLDSNEQTNNHRSVSSSPKHSDGTAKEPIGGSPVSVSDDEEDETRNSDDDELSDVSIKKDDEDLAGSVEESAGSEDRSEDLDSFDEQDDDEWSESFKEGNFEDVRAVSHEREDSCNTLHNTSSLDSESHIPHRYSHNKSTLPFHSITTDTNEILVRKTKSASSKTRRIRSRSKSLSALEKQR